MQLSIFMFKRLSRDCLGKLGCGRHPPTRFSSAGSARRFLVSQCDVPLHAENVPQGSDNKSAAAINR